jgi:hypothetical protein
MVASWHSSSRPSIVTPLTLFATETSTDPLAAPEGKRIFASATRNVANIAMLVTNQNQPLAMLQLGFMADGIFESAAIVGVVTTVLSCGIAALAYVVGKRLGL